MPTLKNFRLMSDKELLACVRARLGLLVRPCDLAKLLRPVDNPYDLLNRLVRRRFAVVSTTIDSGKGRTLYTLAEDMKRLGPRPKKPRLRLRWRVSITFIPGLEPKPAAATHFPRPGKVSWLRFWYGGRRLTEVVQFIGTVPGGWLVRLSEAKCNPTRPKKSRRLRSKRSTHNRRNSTPSGPALIPALCKSA